MYEFHKRQTFLNTHTSFYNINAHVLYHDIDLLLHEVRWSLVDAKHPSRVLRRQCRGDRHRVTAICCDDLLIGFQPSVNLLVVCNSSFAKLYLRSARAVAPCYQENSLVCHFVDTAEVDRSDVETEIPRYGRSCLVNWIDLFNR